MVRATQLSVAGLINALVVAGITASVTAYATVQRVDARMAELVQDVREMKNEHAVIKERVVRVETRVENLHGKTAAPAKN